jgi:hypothetical protein
MTIALAIAVNDGIVLAADSASSMVVSDEESGEIGVANVYNNANKVFNLYKGLPIGSFTYGAGSIGYAAISTLAKDFRAKLKAGQPLAPDSWIFDRATYTLEEVAVHFRHFIYDETYLPAFADSSSKPALGLSVAGYSCHQGEPEMWQIEIDERGECPPPVPLIPRGTYTTNWFGEPEAIGRLMLGFGTGLPQALVSIGLAPADVPAAILAIREELEVGLAAAAMPIQDAIDLAEFLVHLTIMFSRFKPGAPTVGGPIEIAAITKHEGFKWVRRKHYWDVGLNPA